MGAQLQDAGEYWVLTVPGDSALIPLVPSRQGLDFLGWSADGRSLFWQEGTELFRWEFASREMVPLFTLPSLPEDQKWIGGDARTNGSACQPRPGVDPVEFVCAINESVTELFLIENLNPGAD